MGKILRSKWWNYTILKNYELRHSLGSAFFGELNNMNNIDEVRICLKKINTYLINDYIYDGEQSLSIFREKIGDGTIERVGVLFIDIRYRPICYSTLGVGQSEKVNMDISELFKNALLSNAKHIIIAHNHPSGELEPTKEDIEITKRIGSTGKMLRIHLIDSLILGNSEEYLSIRYYIMKKEGNNNGVE